MSARKFDLSYVANTQMALLERREKEALVELFSGHQIDLPTMTRSTGDGRFVSRLGAKRILWRRSQAGRPEILSIIDQSFAQVE